MSVEESKCIILSITPFFSDRKCLLMLTPADLNHQKLLKMCKSFS